MPESSPLYVGIYVDNFVFYSTDPAKEELFCSEIAKEIKVDFMGNVDYFRGDAFTWFRLTNGHLSVHLALSAFTKFSAHRFGVKK